MSCGDFGLLFGNVCQVDRPSNRWLIGIVGYRKLERPCASTGVATEKVAEVRTISSDRACSATGQRSAIFQYHPDNAEEVDG
jgi:hypothetical protein